MKRISDILLIWVIGLLSSCVPVLDYQEDRGILLSVETEEPNLTKVPEEGKDKYNENKISWVDFFIYSGMNVTSDAVAHVRMESGKTRNDSFLLKLTDDDITNIFPGTTKKAYVFAIANADEDLVGKNAQGEEVLTGTDLASLKNKTLVTAFAKEKSNTKNLQTHFLMNGETELTLTNRTAFVVASGNIQLTRYASKLTVGVSVANVVELKNDQGVVEERWESVIDNMRVYLENGVNNVTLGGEKTTGRQYFSYKDNPMKFFDGDKSRPVLEPTKTAEGVVLYYNTYPMYMYPQHWDYGSNEGDTKEPYIKLILTWYRTYPTQTQKEYYYKIVLPDDHRDNDQYLRSFVANNWYHVDIDVSILGSDTNDEAVTVPGTCYRAYWQNQSFVQRVTEIGKARYLFVDKDRWELNNVSSRVSIPYITSHPVELKDINVIRPYYGTKTSGDAMGGTVTSIGGEYYVVYNPTQRKKLNGGKDWLNLDESASTVYFEHELNNDFYSTSFDYSPYTITFTLAHKDRPGEENKTVTIIQNPAIYIDAVHNSDETTTKVDPDSEGHDIYTSEHWGYVFINGRDQNDENWPQNPPDNTPPPERERLVRVDRLKNGSQDPVFQLTDAEQKEYQWQTVYYTGGSKDIFGIHVTVLPQGSPFVIGDPRTSEIDNLDAYNEKSLGAQQGFNSATSLDSESPRKLKYYYPTEGSERTKNMIAPFFRVSSVYGGIEYGGYGNMKTLTMEYARYRCASYQEDGFPAGRWRLPTLGEIQFIAQLSANGAFETLFKTSNHYWSAQGAAYVQTSSVDLKTDVKNALLRCVYDSWYWGDEQQENRGTFYWGDKER